MGTQLRKGGGVTLIMQEIGWQPALHRYRYVEADADGRLVVDLVLASEDSLCFHHKALLYEGSLSLAWVEAGVGLRMAQVRSGEVFVRTILADEHETSSTIGPFWFLNVGGRPRLIVRKMRGVRWAGEVRMDLHPVEFEWLYCYDVSGHQPALIGSAFAEEGPVRASERSCGAFGDRMVLWQTVREADRERETLLCAEWSGKGAISWKPMYTGNYPLDPIVDPSLGAVCVVREWKSPEDGSGICCGIRCGASQAMPLGIFDGRTKRLVQFARVFGQPLWAVAYKTRGCPSRS